MKNPLTGDDPGYGYKKPADGADVTTTVVVYQLHNGKPDLSLDVLYADGNVSSGPDAIVTPLVK